MMRVTCKNNTSMVPCSNNTTVDPCTNNSVDIDQPSSTKFKSFGYPWSRSPRRNFKAPELTPVTTEVVITGTATVIFQEHGATFKGCLASNCDTYSFTGTRKNESTRARSLQLLNLWIDQQNTVKDLQVDGKQNKFVDEEGTMRRRDSENSNNDGSFIESMSIDDMSRDTNSISNDDSKDIDSVSDDGSYMDSIGNDRNKDLDITSYEDSKDMGSAGSSFREEFIFGSLDKFSRKNSNDSETSDDLEFSGTIYNINLFDFQTSCHHRLGEVKCNLETDQCCMESEKVKFISSHRYRGAAAKKVILEIIGRSLWLPNAHVFQGEMSITWEEFVVATPVKYVDNSHSAYARQLRIKSGIMD